MSNLILIIYNWMCLTNLCGPMSVQVYWYSHSSRAAGAERRMYDYMVNPNPDTISRYTRRMNELACSGYPAPRAAVMKEIDSSA